MESKKQKPAPVLRFPYPSNVVSLAEHRARHASPQILTEVVSSEGDRRAHGSESSVVGLLVRQVVSIDELSGVHDHKNNTPPDDLIA